MAPLSLDQGPMGLGRHRVGAHCYATDKNAQAECCAQGLLISIC